jgi:hypothetical protein
MPLIVSQPLARPFCADKLRFLPTFPEEHMDFEYSPKTQELRENLLEFMDSHIYPRGTGVA